MDSDSIFYLGLGAITGSFILASCVTNQISDKRFSKTLKERYDGNLELMLQGIEVCERGKDVPIEFYKKIAQEPTDLYEKYLGPKYSLEYMRVSRKLMNALS
ncbi:hypothetical protein KY321_01460 [Candidatus Woesearchaeota archaeon]|nr:hypothetical protein [Candidatus Woesearchaeota archaeon]